MDSSRPESVSGRPVVGELGATLCHRGIFDVEGDLPFLQHQPTITYAPLRGPIWSASDGTYTTVFLQGKTGVVCFDTFSSPGAAIAYRKAIGRVFPRRSIHTIVYSHDHVDHTGYALDLAPSAEIIAHEECAQVIELRQSDGQKPATEVWSGEQTSYEVDGVRFWLLNPGATHGNGNAAAWFPEQRLLFMVDTVIPGVGYAFLPDWHIASYVSSMRRLEDLDFDLFVPGHFWPLDRAGFSENLDFFEFVTAAGEEALREGVDPSVYSEVQAYAEGRYASSHGQLFRFHEYFAMNLMRAMLHALQGPWGLEDTADIQGDGEPDADNPSIVLQAPSPRAHRGGLGRPIPAGSGAAEPIEVEPVAANLWTASDGHTRAAFALGDEGIVAINTFGNPQTARSYRQAIDRTASGTPIAAVVLSIDHTDHAGFIADLAPDAEIVAHELCARALRARNAEGAGPTRTVPGSGETIALGGVEVAFTYPGPTLGCGNLACHFPAHGALFVVGPRADARYGLFGDWHVEHYVSGLRRLLDLHFEVVLPGGGPIMDRAALERAIAYFDGLQWTVQKAFAEGIAIWDLRAMEEYATEIMRGRFGDLGGFSEHIGVGASRVVHHYLMGGWGIEDTRAPETLLAAPAVT